MRFHGADVSSTPKCCCCYVSQTKPPRYFEVTAERIHLLCARDSQLLCSGPRSKRLAYGDYAAIEPALLAIKRLWRLK